MKHVTIGKYAIPLWILGVVLVGLCIGAFALYMALTFTIPFEVKEPIEILYYPSQVSLYPGDTLYFNVTIKNHASQNYTVLLYFSLDNSTYENSYVTFSNETYFVRPGVQNLTAWLMVSRNAPSTTTTMRVSLYRKSSLSFCEELLITSVEFLGSGTAIQVTLKNTGTIEVTVTEVWVNDERKTTDPLLPQTIYANTWLTLNISCNWLPGNTYEVKVISSRGNQFMYMTRAPSDGAQEESLHLTKLHVWCNTTDGWAEAAFVIINTGTLDTILDKITICGQECPWTNVYYWKTNNVTISNDLEATSTPITGETFNITVQGEERVFQQATDDLTLEVGWTVAIYIMNPDNITVKDVGTTVGISVFTANAQYYKETSVEAIVGMAILNCENIHFYEESGVKKIDIYIRNAGTSDTQIIRLYIGTSNTNLENQTTSPPLPIFLAAGSTAQLTVEYYWTEGNIYYFKIIASDGKALVFQAWAPTS